MLPQGTRRLPWQGIELMSRTAGRYQLRRNPFFHVQIWCRRGTRRNESMIFYACSTIATTPCHFVTRTIITTAVCYAYRTSPVTSFGDTPKIFPSDAAGWEIDAAPVGAALIRHRKNNDDVTFISSHTEYSTNRFS